MHFPSVYEIATKNVLQISDQACLKKALDKMIAASHRNIVVESGHFHHILRAQDVLQFNVQKVDVETVLSSLDIPRLPTLDKTDNVLDSVRFLKEDLEYVGILDEERKLCALLTHTDIVNSIDPEVLMENYTVSDVLNQHRKDIWENVSTSVNDVIATMVRNHTDCVMGLDDSGALKGIFTTKDVMRLYERNEDLEKPLSEYMSHPVQTVGHDVTLKEAINFIKTKHFKRVVVVDEAGQLLGMVQQSELIGLSYSKWAKIMRQFQSELQEINSLLEEKSRHYESMAAHDALTGLYNRYKFTEVFTSEYITMQKRQNNMALIMMDLDYFKRINDELGHNVGDDVLASVAKLVTKSQRQTDVLCRWGGEEFLILLPSANANQAAIIADQLREKIKLLDVVPGRKISASFGVSAVWQDDSLENVVARADTALYQAKQQGRDRVVISQEENV